MRKVGPGAMAPCTNGGTGERNTDAGLCHALRPVTRTGERDNCK